MKIGNHSGQADRKNQALLLALESGDISTAISLVEEGADVNARSPTGWTPLMYASLFGWVDLANILLSKGADPNGETTASKEISSTTVLLLAVGNAQIEIIRLLLKYNVNVNAANSVGTTAMVAAKKNATRRYKQSDMREIVSILNNAEADV